MSRSISVNQIVNQNGNGAPILAIGATVTSGSVTCLGGASVSGILQATSFVGNGSGINNLPGLTIPKGIGLKRVLSYDEHQA